MKKVVLSVIAALAVTAAAPAFAADMPVKGKVAAPVYVSPWDLAFGTAFTSNYVLRGISQSDRKPAIQGYFEGQYKAADWVTLYAGVWGSSISTVIANAEFDISGGARFAWGQFGLDLGYVYYAYPGPVVPTAFATSSISYGEFYAKPSYKLTDWLTIGAVVIGGSDWANSGSSAWYYAGNAAVTLPSVLPYGITTTISGEVGRQTYSSSIKTRGGAGFTDYTTWNAGVAFNYKVITLDLRYHDTNIDIANNATQCGGGPGFTNDECKGAFVAMLKFDALLSALK